MSIVRCASLTRLSVTSSINHHRTVLQPTGRRVPSAGLLLFGLGVISDSVPDGALLGLARLAESSSRLGEMAVEPVGEAHSPSISTVSSTHGTSGCLGW